MIILFLICQWYTIYYCRKCLRVCKNGSKSQATLRKSVFTRLIWCFRRKSGEKASVSHICSCLARNASASLSGVCIMLNSRLKLYARKCKRDSVLTFSVPRVRKYVKPKALFTVPNGCSTNSFRLLNNSRFSLVKASTSSA